MEAPGCRRWSHRVNFNGAAAFRSRKSRACTRSETPNPVFNGAAAFRSRKLLGFFRRLLCRASLQWGRGLSVAEIRRRSSIRIRPQDVFNGAAAFRSRKSAGPRDECRCPLGLQWGRGLSVAEIRANLEPLCEPCHLQWGRGLSVAEIRGPGTSSDRLVRSSMGPRPFGRGNDAPTAGRPPDHVSSMGPRPFGRGNVTGD